MVKKEDLDKAKKPDYLEHRQRVLSSVLLGHAPTFSDYELLEFMLMQVIPQRDVKPIAKALMAKFKTVGPLANATPEEMIEVSGVGRASAGLFMINAEFCKRICRQRLCEESNLILTDPAVIEEYCRSLIGYNDVEEFWVLLLSAKGEFLGEKLLQRGTIDHVAVYTRELTKIVTSGNAKGVILVHNHPSGNVTPSKADLKVTEEINKVLLSIDVELCDHVIIGANDAYSFKLHGGTLMSLAEHYARKSRGLA